MNLGIAPRALRSGAWLGLLGLLLLPACGGSDDGGSTTDGGEEGNKKDDTSERADDCSDPQPESDCDEDWLCVYGEWSCGYDEGGTGGDGDGPLDRCADPRPQAACDSEWYCIESVWECDDETGGGGGSGGSTVNPDPDPNPNPDPNPDPDPDPHPDDFDGAPCTEGPFVEFECATCFCTNEEVYDCAFIADCHDPYPPYVPDQCSAIQPDQGCEGQWICDHSEWRCVQLTW